MFPSPARPSLAWDEGLDEAQLAAATHGAEPLVVVAGAGTGKTRALVARVASLIQRGAPPERILLLTFTRRAADEMVARAANLVALQGERRPWGGTFHAVAHRYVAAYAEALGLPAGFSVIDPGEGCDLMELMRGDYDLDGTEVRTPRSATLVDIYSRCINTGRRLHEVLEVDYPWCRPHFDAIAKLFGAFTARKAQAALLDFDDLLLYWRALLSEESLGRHVAEMFDYVLVDEYQDVNSLQVDIVRLLAPHGRGLTVVGDEAQAIYGFRGADFRHLRELVLDYPDASVIRLQRNFRSRQGILDVANAVRPNGEGPGREGSTWESTGLWLFSERGRGIQPALVHCHDASAEATAVVERVLEAHERGTPLREQAVLVRAAHHSDLIELELTARKIPYRKYGGLRFLEAAHVKDFVMAARLLDNPHDEIAWYRLLRLHDSIGPSRARALVGTVRETRDVLGDWPQLVAAAPAGARSALSVTLDKLLEARSQRAPGPRAEIVLGAIRPLLVGRYPDAAVRLRDLERLAGAAAKAPDMATWLAELTLDPPESTGDLAGLPHLDEDYLVISTIHSAKGLEWSAVHVPHVVDGFIPIDMALGTPDGLEEERRLFYVAVTRARDELYLYAPLRMHYHRRGGDDRHGFALQSRFLDPAVMPALAVVEQPVHRVSVPAGAAASRIPVDVNSLWS
ncbi:MAG: ATP-dependent helicase [Acidimicrobiales bacterium]|jgi:DNA helicase-2/ATP-dependent DNA helicase PcrA